MRFIAAFALVLVACNSGAKTSGSPDAATAVQQKNTGGATATAAPATGQEGAPANGGAAQNASSDSGKETAAPRTGAPLAGATQRKGTVDLPVVRGLYVNRFAAQSKRRMASLIALADSTEINAFVIDIKDEFGINYRSTDSMVIRNAGRAGAIPELPALLDTMKAHGIMPIARIVVFKDSVTARVNPDWTIRKADGGAWRDKEGLTWVNPYNRHIWEYNLRIAEEVVRLGFQEIQWDYIRFPEPYKSLPQQVFPGSNGESKPEALASFLADARTRLGKLGIRSTADIFGLVTTVPGALEIGQKWEPVAQTTDVILPMVYPSHYPRGAFGSDRPNAEPYKTVFRAIARAHERNLALGIHGESVRPWLQAFSLGQPEYGPSHLAEQKRAVYDAGFDGWVLWHPGSRYEIFREALEPKLESRKKPYQAAAQDR